MKFQLLKEDEGQCELLYYIPPGDDLLLPLIRFLKSVLILKLKDSSEHNHCVTLYSSSFCSWFQFLFKTRKLEHFVFKTNRPAKPDKSKISLDRQTDRQTRRPIEAPSRSLKSESYYFHHYLTVSKPRNLIKTTKNQHNILNYQNLMVLSQIFRLPCNIFN